MVTCIYFLPYVQVLKMTLFKPHSVNFVMPSCHITPTHFAHQLYLLLPHRDGILFPSLSFLVQIKDTFSPKTQGCRIDFEEFVGFFISKESINRAHHRGGSHMII